MADKYFGFGGDDASGDGSEGNPYLTYNQAQSASSAGDTCFMVSGPDVSAHASLGYMNISLSRTVKAKSYREATLNPDAAETLFCVRHSSAIVASGNPHILDGIIFDSKGLVSRVYDGGRVSSQDIHAIYRNCEFKNGTQIPFRVQQGRGRVDIVNCKVSGAISGSGATMTGISQDSNQDVDVSGLEIDLSATATSVKGLEISKTNNLTNAATVSVKNVTGSISSDASTSVAGVILVSGFDAPDIVGNKITVKSEATSFSSYGISVKGLSIATTTNANISNNHVDFLSLAGYGIILGESTVTSVSDGNVNGNSVKGQYTPSQTPHNIAVGSNTNSDMRGNLSQDGFVGYLASLVNTALIEGNVALNCFGPSYYIKGTTACELKGNIALLDGTFTQRSRGVICVTSQSGVNTLSATIEGNTVICNNTDIIHSLAQITDASQTCTYSNNLYIVPDTVDIDTELLFAHNSSTRNNTLAQWNAQANVTAERIEQMPVSAINKLIQANTPQAGKAGGILSLMPLSLSQQSL